MYIYYINTNIHVNLRHFASPRMLIYSLGGNSACVLVSVAYMILSICSRTIVNTSTRSSRRDATHCTYVHTHTHAYTSKLPNILKLIHAQLTQGRDAPKRRLEIQYRITIKRQNDHIGQILHGRRKLGDLIPR